MNLPKVTYDTPDNPEGKVLVTCKCSKCGGVITQFNAVQLPGANKSNSGDAGKICSDPRLHDALMVVAK